MVILLFGISNVGKSTTGEQLAEKLDYTFQDLDEEIKKRFQTTIEAFIQDNPSPYERHKIKGKLLRNLIEASKENVVIAVSPIFYARHFNRLLDLEQVMAIELQDSKEHIFERLIFSDEHGNSYKDDAYKERYKRGYLKTIQADIVFARKVFKKITHKYYIDNKPVGQVADELVELIEMETEENMNP